MSEVETHGPAEKLSTYKVFPDIQWGMPKRIPRTRTFRVVDLRQVYIPHNRGPGGGQVGIHNSGVPFTIACTGIDFGKTMCGVWDSFIHAHLNPGCCQLICAETYPTIRDSIQFRMEKEFQRLTDITGWNPVKRFHTRDQILEFECGSRILFRALRKANTGEPGDLTRGPEVSYLWVDESEKVSRKGYQTAYGRVREDAYYFRVLLTGNPRGHNWISKYKHLAKKYPNIYKWVEGTTHDNPYASESYKLLLEYEYDELTYNQEVRGQIVSNIGQIYKMFSPREYPHGNVIDWDAKLRTYSANDEIPTTLVVDPAPNWGAALLIAHDPYSRLDIVEDEIVLENSTIENIIHEVFKRGWEFGEIIRDPKASEAGEYLERAFPQAEIYWPSKHYEIDVISGIRRTASRLLNMRGQRRMLVNKKLTDPERMNNPETELAATFGIYQGFKEYEWLEVNGIAMDKPRKNQFSHPADCVRFYNAVHYPLAGHIRFPSRFEDEISPGLVVPITIVPKGMNKSEFYQELRTNLGRRVELSNVRLTA